MGNIKKSFYHWCKEHGAEELLVCYENGDNPLPADKIGFSVAREVRFRCPKCGYGWTRTLNHATRESRRLDCPNCNGRVGTPLAEKYPEVAAQFGEKNTVPLDKITCKSKQYLHWRCRQCHNDWWAVVGDRTRAADLVRRKGGELCPFCGKQRVSPQYNLAVCHPEVARQWDYAKNGSLRPENCFPAGNQKVWWKCAFDPSHSWQDKIANRTILRRGCPRCSRLFKTTYTSRALFFYLQRVFPDCACEYQVGKYHLDVCLPSVRIAIEHHGYTHQRQAAQKRDVRRREELKKKGYRVLWLVESSHPMSGYDRQGDVLTYFNPATNDRLDDLISYVMEWLKALTGMTFHYDAPDFARDHYKIEDAYYRERKKRSLAVVCPELASEWSSENECAPDTVFSGSNRKVKWVCPKCGGTYPATVVNRVKNHSGCPCCAVLVNKNWTQELKNHTAMFAE